MCKKILTFGVFDKFRLGYVVLFKKLAEYVMITSCCGGGVQS